VSSVVIVFAIAVLASAVAHVAILTSVVRRASSVADANVPRPRLIVEIAWALIPMLALALVFTATWSRVREHATPEPGAVMEIAR
jgi:heme/copper-type cytochrome/quinol oxidase subunit 2